MVVFGQRWLYSGKGGCNPAKLLYSDKSGFNSGRSCCIRAKWLYSCKVVVFGYQLCIKSVSIKANVVVSEQSGGILAKLVIFGQKSLNSGKSGSIRVKVVVIE